MKTTLPILAAAACAAASLSLAAQPRLAPAWRGAAPSRAADSWNEALAGRLTLGTRLTPYLLLKTDSTNGFLGTIVKLDAQEDFFPCKFFAEYQFTPRWGVDLTWDQIVARAVTRARDQHMDGDFELTGPILSAVCQLEKHGRFQPYAELGVAWMQGNFDPAKWWALGYAHETDWIQLGSSDEARNSITRDIRVDNAPGLVAAAGGRIELSKNWSGDILLRYMYLETDAQFTEYRKGKPITKVGEVNTIPFSNLALGLGVSYTF